jgi:hypothetical protein
MFLHANFGTWFHSVFDDIPQYGTWSIDRHSAGDWRDPLIATRLSVPDSTLLMRLSKSGRLGRPLAGFDGEDDPRTGLEAVILLRRMQGPAERIGGSGMEKA